MLDGHLEEQLREKRAGGMSWEEMARRFYAEHGIPISGATIRSWGKRLGIPEPGAPDEPDDDGPMAATG